MLNLFISRLGLESSLGRINQESSCILLNHQSSRSIRIFFILGLDHLSSRNITKIFFLEKYKKLFQGFFVFQAWGWKVCQVAPVSTTELMIFKMIQILMVLMVVIMEAMMTSQSTLREAAILWLFLKTVFLKFLENFQKNGNSSGIYRSCFPRTISKYPEQLFSRTSQDCYVSLFCFSSLFINSFY